jgi:hypothetical protein
MTTRPFIGVRSRNTPISQVKMHTSGGDLRISRCGIARDRGGAVRFVLKEVANATGQRERPKGQPPQPMLQDNTDSNVQELKNQIQAERQKELQATVAAVGDPALASGTPAQRISAAAYGPTGVAAPRVPGQPCLQSQQGDMQMQLTPVQQQAQLIAAKERERCGQLTFRFQPRGSRPGFRRDGGGRLCRQKWHSLLP